MSVGITIDEEGLSKVTGLEINLEQVMDLQELIKKFVGEALERVSCSRSMLRPVLKK